MHYRRESFAMVNKNGFNILYLMVVTKTYFKENDLRTFALGKQQYDPNQSYKECVVSKTCQYERKKFI